MQNLSIPQNTLSHYLIPLFEAMGLNQALHALLYHGFALIIIFAIAFLGFFIASRFLNNKVTKLVVRTKTHIDDALHQHGFFSRLAHVVPASAISIVNKALYAPQSTPAYALDLIATVYLIIAVTSIFNAVLNTIHSHYNSSRYAKRIPIDGFIQVGKLIVVAIALLLITARLLDKSPTLLLSGLGAITAILLLVFKDTILGFVAGINIAANRTVNNGDWVEIPSHGADGTVLALGLTTVKVRNWDNTITTIPTYALMNEEVKNWRGMEESGGRRIKRVINIDAHTVRPCTEALEAQLSKHGMLHGTPYPELAQTRSASTNLGLYRQYLHHYLTTHPLISDNLTLLVRQLETNSVGIPIEIYCFSKEKAWAKYETLQAEILEHFIAILPQFELRIFQRISDRVEVLQHQNNSQTNTIQQ